MLAQSYDAMASMIKQASLSSAKNSSTVLNLSTIINNIALFKYDAAFFWSPHIFIENAISETRKETRRKLEIVKKSNQQTGLDVHEVDQPQACEMTVRVREMQLLTATFYERLELFDFQVDSLSVYGGLTLINVYLSIIYSFLL